MLEHHNSYFRNNWNKLDFIIISVAMLEYANVELRMLSRSIQVLKSIRILTSIKKMRNLIITIIDSFVDLKEIMLITVIIIYIFANIGMIYWSSDINYRWRYDPEPVNGDWPVIEDDTRPWGYRKCSVGYCGSLFEQYQKDPDSLDMDIIGTLYRDTQISSLQFGIVNFDNFQNAALLMFQLLTFEGWMMIMNNYRDASGHPLPITYFLLVIIIWSFLLTNFVIAVLFKNFEEKKNREKDDREFEALAEKVKSADIPQNLKDLFLDQTYYFNSIKSEIIFTKELVCLVHPIKKFAEIKPPKTKYYKRTW